MIELDHSSRKTSHMGKVRSLGKEVPPVTLAMQQDIRAHMPQQRRLIQFAVVATATSLILLFLKYKGPFAPERSVLPTLFSAHKDGGVDWSQFAYVQYVTSVPYLCNSLMLFSRLHELGSKADRLLLYPQQYNLDESEGNAAGLLLRRARENYGVILKPIEVQHKESLDCKSMRLRYLSNGHVPNAPQHKYAG